MSIPVMLAAGLVEAIELFEVPGLTAMIPQLLVGFVVAGILGYLSIRWFLGYLRQKTLLPFAVYCAVVGVIVIFIASTR